MKRVVHCVEVWARRARVGTTRGLILVVLGCAASTESVVAKPAQRVDAQSDEREVRGDGDALDAVIALVEAGEIDAARAELERLGAAAITDVQTSGVDELNVNAAMRIAEVAALVELFELQARLCECVLVALEKRLGAEDLLSLEIAQSLAVARFNIGDVAGAHALFERVHAGREAQLPADDASLLVAKANLSAVCTELGNLERALELGRQVHDVYARTLPDEHQALLDAKLNLAATLHALGFFDEAREFGEHVHAVYTRMLAPDAPQLLRAKENLAVTCESQGDMARLREVLQGSSDAMRRSYPPDHTELVSVIERLASANFECGDIEAAHALHEEVLYARVGNLAPNDPELLRAMHNVAVTRGLLGDRPGALELFEELHAEYERTLAPDDDLVLATKQSLAQARKRVGDLDGAALLLEEVVAARERLLSPDHPDALAAALLLASTRGQPEDLGAVIALAERAVEAHASRVHAFHSQLLAARQNLGTLLTLAGDHERAHALFEEVYAAREQMLPPSHTDRLSAAEHLATTFGALGDFEGLRATTADMLSGVVAAANATALQSPRFARAAAVRELDRLEVAAAWSEAIGGAGLATLDAELFAALESLRNASTSSIEVARAAALAPELRATVDDLARVRREVSSASLAAPLEPDAFASWRAHLVAVAESRDRIERELRRALADAGVATQESTVARVAQRLEPDSAFVSYWSHRRRGAANATSGANDLGVDSLLAFVVTPDGVVRRVELGASAALEAAVESWRLRIGQPLERGIGDVEDADALEFEAGRALRAALLDPVLAVLGDAAPRVLHVVPDGLVHLVPLDALPWDDGRRVGESLAVRLDPSTARLLRGASERASAGTLVAIGGVDFAYAGDDDANATLRSGPRAAFAPLLASRIEAQFTATLFDEHVGGTPELLLGRDATIDALIARAGRARFLHIATHGWFTPESEAVSLLDRITDDALPSATIEHARATLVGFLPDTLCGLALAGANHGAAGRLTAEALASFDLTACELAVLSACETNVGVRRAGQGMRSLQSALHAAGARTAITSLWRVSDASTMRLFELFYTKLWSENLGPADALWQAKMALRSEGHPTRDWAGWVLTGDPD